MPLLGSSGEPAVTLGNNSVIFGPTHVGTASAPQSLTLTNSGSLPMSNNSVAAASGVGLRIELAAIPIRPEVRAVCEHTGMDLYTAIS